VLVGRVSSRGGLWAFLSEQICGLAPSRLSTLTGLDSATPEPGCYLLVTNHRLEQELYAGRFIPTYLTPVLPGFRFHPRCRLRVAW
jgi:hypothetical protein